MLVTFLKAFLGVFKSDVARSCGDTKYPRMKNRWLVELQHMSVVIHKEMQILSPMNGHTRNLGSRVHPTIGTGGHAERVRLRVDLIKICRIVYKRYNNESDVVIYIKFNWIKRNSQNKGSKDVGCWVENKYLQTCGEVLSNANRPLMSVLGPNPPVSQSLSRDLMIPSQG